MIRRSSVKKTSRSVEVTGDIYIDLYQFTEEELDDLILSAQRIVKLCNLVEQEFDRKAIANEALLLLNGLKEVR